MRRNILLFAACLVSCSPVHVRPLDVQIAIERYYSASLDGSGAAIGCAPISHFRSSDDDGDHARVDVRFALPGGATSPIMTLYLVRSGAVGWHIPREMKLPGLPCHALPLADI